MTGCIFICEVLLAANDTHRIKVLRLSNDHPCSAIRQALQAGYQVKVELKVVALRAVKAE